MSERKTRKLEEIVTRFIDYRGKTPTKTDSGVPLITAKIVKDGGLSPYTEYIADGSYYDWMTRGIPEKNDVIITTEAPLGEVALMPEGQVALAQRIIVMHTNPEECDSIYLKYFLQWEVGKQCVLNKQSGSTVFGIRSAELKKAQVTIHANTDEQKRIAFLLHTIDEKIALNRRLNDNLESMAQALYDYWFVQFDFPDENGKPYKSSGGKMVWNDKLQRKIPEGWQVRKIEDIVETCLGGTPDTSNIEYWHNGDIPWVSSGDLSYNPLLKATGFITPLGLNNSAAKLMPKGTVVVSLVRYIRPSILGIDAAGNQSVVGLLATESFPTCFLYPYVKSEVPRLMSLRTGAQQPHINKSVIDTSWISFPNDEHIMQRYKNAANNLYDKIMSVAKEKELLNQQRDFLLPLLMNGQVQVKPQGVNYHFLQHLVA